MSLAAFRDLGRQPPPPQDSTETDEDHNNENTKAPSASPPVDTVESLKTKNNAAELRSNRRRLLTSPRWSSLSPLPPPRTLSTARCRLHAGDGGKNTREDLTKKSTRGKGRSYERMASYSHGLASGRGVSDHTVDNKGGPAVASEKRKDPSKEKSKVAATRTPEAPSRPLQPSKGEEAAAAGGMNATTHNNTTPGSTPCSTPPTAVITLSVGSGRLLTSTNTSNTASTRATAPPSARTSAVLEAFLLGMQNCLNKQALVFQGLHAKLAKVEGQLSMRSPSLSGGGEFLNLVSASSSRDDNKKREWLLSPSSRLRRLELSPTNPTGNDYEPGLASIRCSVGTQTESLVAAMENEEEEEERRRRPTVSSPQVYRASSNSSTGSQSAMPEIELTPSFVAQAQSSTSCSVVVVHPTLERIFPTALPSFLKLAEPLEQTITTAVSPNAARVENPKATTMSAVSKPLAEQLSPTPVKVAAAGSTPPSPPGSPRPVQLDSPTPSSPPTAVSSPLFHKMLCNDPLSAPFTLGGNALAERAAGEEGNNNTGGHPAVKRRRSYALRRNSPKSDRGERARSASAVGPSTPSLAVPARRSSAVQWGGGAITRGTTATNTTDDLQRTPYGDRYAQFFYGTPPPSSTSNSPQLPIAANMRRSHSGSVFSGNAPGGGGGTTIWTVSSTGAATGNSSLRPVSASNVMSFITSADSVTLSPLSRPMSTCGGSPVVQSVLTGGSLAQQPHLLQPQHQQYGVPGSSHSPPGSAVRGANTTSNNKNKGDTAAAGDVTAIPVSSTSPHTPQLFSFVSPTSAAATSSNGSPFALATSSNGGGIGGPVQHPQLQANMLPSSSSSVSYQYSISDNTTIAGPGGGDAAIPAPTPMYRLSADALSSLSASSSLPPSALASITSRCASGIVAFNANKAPSNSFSHHNSSTFASENSLDEEVRAAQHAAAFSHPTSTNADFAAPPPTSLRSWEVAEDGEDECSSAAANFGFRPVQSPVAGSGNNDGIRAVVSANIPTSATVVPTSRQLALSASPSVERGGSRDSGEPPNQLEGQTSLQIRNLAHREGEDMDEDDVEVDSEHGDWVKEGSRQMDPVTVTAATADSAGVQGDLAVAQEDPGKDEQQQQRQEVTTTSTTSTSTIFNPFAIPPPPSSLSELHAHQQRARLRAAPVRTMRRPPMAPSRPANLSRDSASTCYGSPTTTHEGENNDSSNSQTTGFDDARAVQQEQWLSFERQHEKTHLPACWRDSEVVVVDHVEEKDRERDEEAVAQLRLLEAELMGCWPVTPSSSEQESSQVRKGMADEEGDWEDESLWRRSGHPYNFPADRDPFEDSDAEIKNSADAVDDEGDDDDKREGSFESCLAQYRRMLMVQRRRSVRASRHRSQTIASNNSSSSSNNNDVGRGVMSRSHGSCAGRHRRHRLEREDVTEGSNNITSSASKAPDAYLNNREGHLMPPPPLAPPCVSGSTQSSSISAEPREASRSFCRGHSVPAVVSDSGTTEWQNLRARFDELVMIQHRMRAGEDGDGGGLSVGDSGIAQTNGDLVVNEGNTNSSANGYQRTNSEQRWPRRRRGRSAPLPSVITVPPTDVGRITATSAGVDRDDRCQPQAGGLRAPMATLQLARGACDNEESDSATATSTLFTMPPRVKSRRGTLAYDDGGSGGHCRNEKTAQATTTTTTVAEALFSFPNNASQQENVTAVIELPHRELTGVSTEKATVDGDDEHTKDTLATETSCPSITTTEGERQRTTLPLLITKSIRHVMSADEVREVEFSSAPTGLPLRSTEADRHYTDGDSTPEQHHRVLHTDAKDASSSSQPTSTAATIGPATVEEPHVGEDEEEVEELESLATTEGGKAGTTDEQPQPQQRCFTTGSVYTLVIARPPRTPRLRFTQTPRGGITRSTVLRRPRRIVVSQSVPSKANTKKKKFTAESGNSINNTNSNTTDVDAHTHTQKTTSSKGTTITAAAAAAQERPHGTKTREGLVSAKTRKTTGKRKRTTCHGTAAAAGGGDGGAGAGPIIDNPTEVSPSRMHKEAPTKGAAVLLPPNHLANNPNNSNANDATSGGEAVEPRPRGTSTVSHTFLTSPRSFSAGTTTTATPSIIEEARISIAATSAIVPPSILEPQTPQTEQQTTKKLITTNTPTSEPQRKSISGDSNVRSSGAVRRDKHRVREEERGLHKATEKFTNNNTTTSSTSTGGEGSSELGSASDARTFLHRLAQRKGRTRVMEECLRLSSGNFTSLMTALTARTTTDGSSNDGGSIIDSAASTPVRHIAKNQSCAESTTQAVAVAHTLSTVRTPERTSLHEDEENNTVTRDARSPIAAPLAIPTDTNRNNTAAPVPSSNNNSARSSHLSSEQRHVNAVGSEEGPSVTFMHSHQVLQPHTSGFTCGKANTRRRLLDVRGRSTTSNKQNFSSTYTPPITVAATTSSGQPRAPNTNKATSFIPSTTLSSSTALPAAAAPAVLPSPSSVAVGNSNTTNMAHAHSQHDSTRLRVLYDSPPPSALLLQERRRHTIGGDVPFRTTPNEKSLRPTRTAVQN